MGECFPMFSGSCAEWATAFITLGAVGVAFRTLDALIRQVTANEDSAKAAMDNAATALEEATAIKLAERAYISVSPVPPGLTFGEEPKKGEYHVRLKITCCGRTPATIIDTVVVGKCFAENKMLPTEPDYSDGSHTNGTIFLIPSDFVFADEQHLFDSGDQPDVIADLVKSDHVRFVIFGYVDYIDIFGMRRRYGFARQYDPRVDNREYKDEEARSKRVNLQCVPESGYNYDEERSTNGVCSI